MIGTGAQAGARAVALAGAGAGTRAQAGSLWAGSPAGSSCTASGSPRAGARSPAGSWSPAEVAAGTTPPSRASEVLGAGSSSTDGGAAARGEKLTLLPASPCALQRQNPAQGRPEKPQPGRNPPRDVSLTAVHPLGALSPVLASGPIPASGGSSLWGRHRPIPACPMHPAPGFSPSGSASVSSGSWITLAE